MMMHKQFYPKVWGSETWFTHNPLSYMIKYLITIDTLSVQVHPCKDETWVILEAKDDAGIYLGVKPDFSKKDFEETVHSGGDLSQFLSYYKVSPGNVFHVPTGTVHAIGKGIKLLEVQQNVDITYRGWDWNRLENGVPRALHMDAFLKAARFEVERNLKDFFFLEENLFNRSEGSLIKTDHYQIFKNYAKAHTFEKESMAIDLVHLALKHEKTPIKFYKPFSEKSFERPFLFVST